MVLCMKKKKKIIEDINNIDENFYLGKPDYAKFTPGNVVNFASERRVWLFNEKLAKQTKIQTVHQGSYEIQSGRSQRGGGAGLVISEDSLSSNVVRGSTHPPPSSPHEKREMFRTTLTNILSCIYGVFIVTLGVVIYIGEIMTGNPPLAEVFSIYLVVAGIAYITFLYSDMKKFSKILKISEELIQAQYGSGGGGRSEPASVEASSVGRAVSIEWSSLEPGLVLPRDYAFPRRAVGGGLYLKLGAAGFCLGHLIHSGLLISYHVTFLLSQPYAFYECTSSVTLVLDLLYPTYSFLQLFFIFKYSNVIINKRKVLARFAVMHCIGANLCFWIWTILRETVDSLDHHSAHELPTSLHHVNTLQHSATNGNESEIRSLYSCQGPNQFSTIFMAFTPYLYPFTIEYSILVAGVMFIIWQNIGGYVEGASFPVHPEQVSNVAFQADCHSSNKGLFAGLIVLVGSFLSIILFFVAMHDSNYAEVGLLLNSGTELILSLLMTLTLIPAYRQITKLDVMNLKCSQRLDDLLLFTCIPAFFVLTILSGIPLWNSEKYINLITIIIQMVQVLIQTPFMIDGLRRCANSKKLRSEKPGRELLMFLIVCNVTMWIIETFEIKSHSSRQDPRSLYYGEFIWSSITHLTFPLTMFYRFHSSVCMVEIWKSGYSKEQS